ncbi:hypothetical protein KY092_20500 [Natronomonas gomsonensis]|uniref:hypothetical protein n=1 Tax=Natronomonas gomsonensis TaxID=1046043 RepID=UPI00227A68D7|nr:hypothetical protein [Natronomonas gomsonensis]MCY4732913.1 hypothetical protein [Natronomonas gomsonensis]
MSEPPIEAVPTRCGCAGKTPLDRIVRPAIAGIRRNVPDVAIVDGLEAGLLPKTAGIERSVADGDGGGDGTARDFVAAAFVGPECGSDSEAFRAALSETYRRWAGRSGGATIRKGHSIQLETDSEPTVWGEAFRSTGPRRDGYRAVNVDVIHALPGLDPVAQAAVATVHALNDCYTQGAAADRDVRPIVGFPEGSGIDPDRVHRWYAEAAGSGVTVGEPSLVGHDGRGWQFGASVLAATERVPPIHTGRIDAGDAVSLHRPVGSLALYAGSVDSERPVESDVRKRALDALTADHAAVARAIEASCPRPGEPFDPGRHLKWAGDISGPGIGGLAEVTAGAGCGLSLEAVPPLDRRGLDAVRRRWIVPDVTVETNGPIAAIGTADALDRFERRLSGCPSADPTRIGTVTDAPGEFRWTDGSHAGRYLDGVERHPQ